MKKILAFLIFCIVAATLSANDWIITVQGIKEEKNGTLLLAVYPGEEGYMDRSKIIYKESIPVSSDEIQFTVKDLTPGEYSFAILHDEDGDNIMKTGVIMPKEGFAFSGKKQPAGKPPKYKNAYVTVDSEVVESSAQMKYY